MKILPIVLAITMALVGRGAAAEESARRYLTIDDVLAAEKVHVRSPLAVSPDGVLVAVTVQAASEDRLIPDSFFTRDGISGENLGCTVRLVRLGDAFPVESRQFRFGVESPTAACGVSLGLSGPFAFCAGSPSRVRNGRER